MSKLWGQLKGLVLEPEAPKAEVSPTPAPAPAPLPSAVAANVAQTMGAMAAVPSGYSDVPSVLDVTHVAEQLTALIESDPGFQVYKRFQDTADTLADTITDESTRIKAAAKVSGSDVVALTGSLKTWEAVLTNEQAQFQASFVAQNEQEIQALADQAAAVETQIVELAQKLSQLSAEKQKLERDSVQRTAELGKAKIDFDSVVQTLNNRYTSVLNKLTKFLGV